MWYFVQIPNSCNQRPKSRNHKHTHIDTPPKNEHQNPTQACKNKDINSANIDDILSDMLNIDDCDLFTMHGDGGADDDDDDFEDDEDDDINAMGASNANNLRNRMHHRRRRNANNADDLDYDRDGSGSDDDYDPRRIHDDNGFDDDDDNNDQLNNAHGRNNEDDDNNDDDDDENDDDDGDVQSVNRSQRRLRHQRIVSVVGLQRRTSTTAQRSNQLIIDSGDDNANVHSFDNLKFDDADDDNVAANRSTFDISPWDTPIDIASNSNAVAAANTGSRASVVASDFSSTSFFTGEVNFHAHFPSVTTSATATSEAGVSAVFDPVDPFGSATFGTTTSMTTDDDVPFVFDASIAFGDFGEDIGTTTTTANVEAAAAEPIRSCVAKADETSAQQVVTTAEVEMGGPPVGAEQIKKNIVGPLKQQQPLSCCDPIKVNGDGGGSAVAAVVPENIGLKK